MTFMDVDTDLFQYPLFPPIDMDIAFDASDSMRQNYSFKMPFSAIYPEHVFPALNYEDVELETLDKQFPNVKMSLYGTTRRNEEVMYYIYVSATPLVLATERMAISVTVDFKDGDLGPGEVSLAKLFAASFQILERFAWGHHSLPGDPGHPKDENFQILRCGGPTAMFDSPLRTTSERTLDQMVHEYGGKQEYNFRSVQSRPAYVEFEPSPIKLSTSGFIFKKTSSILEESQHDAESHGRDLESEKSSVAALFSTLPPPEDDEHTPEHAALNICVTEIIEEVLPLIISRDLISGAGRQIIAPKIRNLVARVYGTTFLGFVDLCNKFYWGVSEDLAHISRMAEGVTKGVLYEFGPTDVERLTRVVEHISIFGELCTMCGPGCCAMSLFQRMPIIAELSAAIVRYIAFLFGFAVSNSPTIPSKPKSWADVVKTPPRAVVPSKPTPSAIDPDDMGDDFNDPCPDDGCGVYGTTYYV
jgi:hypothetical protein